MQNIFDLLHRCSLEMFCLWSALFFFSDTPQLTVGICILAYSEREVKHILALMTGTAINNRHFPVLLAIYLE